MSEQRPTLHVPARDVPVPRSVSPEAQAILAMPPMASPESPAVDDLDGWRSMIAAYDETVGALVSARVADAAVACHQTIRSRPVSTTASRPTERS